MKNDEKFEEAAAGIVVLDPQSGRRYRVQNKVRKVMEVRVMEVKREWLSTEEVKAIYGIGEVVLLELVKKRAIKRICIGKGWKYRGRDFDLYFEKASVGKVHRAI